MRLHPANAVHADEDFRRWDLIKKVPRHKTPPGVTLGLLARDEVNATPVLICETCQAPTLHARCLDRAGCVCQTCNTWRRW